jgi:predicted exporter
VTERRPLLLLGVVLLGFALVVATRLHVGTNITNLMPTGTEGTLAAISRHLTETELSRTMVLSIGGEDLGRALAAARALAADLSAMPEVAWVRTGVGADQMEAIYKLYFPRRFYFVSDDPSSIAALTSDEALRARAEEARRELASPAGTLLKRILPEDPLGFFPRIALRLRDAQPDLRLQDDQFVSRDGRFAVLFLGTRASAFDGAAQASFLDQLDRRFRAVDQAQGGGLVLESSGANRFAVAAERSIRRDVQFVSLLSVVGVFALFHACFRSGRAILLGALPVLSGIVVATGSGILVFGGLDGLTLGFGAALIGVVIDYPTFFLTHVAFAGPGVSTRATARAVAPSIGLGALTTMGSFAGLGLTHFPGFRQIAFFAVVGVATALAVTLWVLPGLAVPGEPVPPLARRLAHWLGEAVVQSLRHRRALGLLALGLGVLSLPLIPRIHWVDDLSRLWRMDPALQAEDRRVRERVSQVDTSRFVIALAPDQESAVRLNEQVHARLQRAVAAGALDGIRSLHSFLWSRELQQANRAALLAAPRLAERVERAFGEAGFKPEAFAPFAAELAADPPPPLDFADLAASPLGDAVRPLLFQLGPSAAAVTYLRGIHDVEAIRRVIADLPDVHYFDQKAFLDELYADFRATTVEQIFVGNLLVVGLLLLRYRQLRPALAAYFPSVLVALLLLACFAATGTETNLLHAVSLVMVTGMGVDYGVFVIDTARDRRAMGTTMLSVLLCCLTTVLTFGVLAVSQHPALRAIGVTTGLGLLLSFLLAPLALLLDRPAPERRARA